MQQIARAFLVGTDLQGGRVLYVLPISGALEVLKILAVRQEH